ncbi:MAG: hypothetical protein K6348_05260 [Deferribacterales bacterium]
MKRNIDQIKRDYISLGSFIIKTMENSPRFFAGHNRQSLMLLADELAKQGSVKNIIILDDSGRKIYSFKDVSDDFFDDRSDSELNVKDEKDLIILKKDIKLIRHGMMGRGFFRKFFDKDDNDKPEEFKYKIILHLSKEPIKKIEKDALGNIFLLVVAEILLIIIYMIMLRLFSKYRIATEKLNRYEKDAELGKLANILAHEIKNPLSSMKGFSEYIYERLDSEELADYMDKILDEIDRLNTIVNDFLTYGREISLNKSRFSIKEVIDKSVSLLKYDIENKGVTVEIIGDDFYIEADKVKLTQVMLNLILNAVQGSPENRVIKIYLKDKSLAIINDVKSDANIDKNKLFIPFYTTKSKGSGLGLAISKKILESHNFSISIEGVSPFVVKIYFGE